MGCKECGKPKCNGKCGCKSPKVLQINNPAEYITFHKVSIPAAMGDSTTNPPKIGAYRNALVYYEADHTSWMYSTDGIPTKLTNGLTDYNEAVNLPQINGHTLIGNQSSSDLGLQGELTAGANIQINDNVISATNTTYTAGNGIELDGTEIKAKIGDGLEFDSNGEIDIADIEQYAHFFDTVADMKASTNLIDGSYAKTLGYYEVNDGGEGLYKIRNKEVSDVVDNSLIHELTSDNTLVAELVYSKQLNVKSLGCKTDKSADCSAILQNAIDKLDNITLFFPHGAYKCDTAITSKSRINYSGEFYQPYTLNSTEGLFFNGTNGIVNCIFNRFDGMMIQNETYDESGNTSGIDIERSVYITNSSISQFNIGINCHYASAICDKVSLHNNGVGVTNPVDSRFTNCTLNANKSHAFSLAAGANDNIITNCKIEWNDGYGIISTGAIQHCVISDNIFDRNSRSGIGLGSGTTKCSITNNILRRNGVTGDGYLNANIYLNNAYDNVISNNVTQTGNSKDDGTGTVVPAYALYAVDFYDRKLSLINNELTGGTATNPVYILRSTNVTRLDAVKPVYDNLLVTTKTATVTASGGTATYEIPFDTEPQAYTYGYYKKVIIRTRDTNDGSNAVKAAYIYFYKAYGTLRASVSESTLLTDVTLSASYDAENGVVLTVTNNKSVNLQARVDVYNA